MRYICMYINVNEKNNPLKLETIRKTFIWWWRVDD